MQCDWLGERGRLNQKRMSAKARLRLLDSASSSDDYSLKERDRLTEQIQKIDWRMKMIEEIEAKMNGT